MPRSLVVAALLAGSLALTACGGGDDAAPATGSSAPAPAAGGSSASGGVTFNGVAVSNPTDLGSAPQATSSATRTPTTLEYKDLVVGKGASAGPTSTVNVQYQGLIYSSGKGFDSSWDRGGDPISFPLSGVVPGFTQGIGGTAEVPPMKVGGRRIMILPPALGYPEGTPDGAIPPGTPIVFVVDLVSVS